MRRSSVMVGGALLVCGLIELGDRGILAQHIDSALSNPHSDLIFRATGAVSCGDCHRTGRDGEFTALMKDNELVRTLKSKAPGIHGPGRFADCLRCHAGGDKGVEKYRKH
jgi:hypothetical protein